MNFSQKCLHTSFLCSGRFDKVSCGPYPLFCFFAHPPPQGHCGLCNNKCNFCFLCTIIQIQILQREFLQSSTTNEKIKLNEPWTNTHLRLNKQHSHYIQQLQCVVRYMARCMYHRWVIPDRNPELL